MLPRENRLKKMKDIEILFKKGQFFAGRGVSMQLWQIDTSLYPKRNYNTNQLKINAIVSKKTDKRAVIRNRKKRQIREICRLLLKEDKIKNGYFLSFLAGPKSLDQDYHEIKENIVFLLNKAGIYKSS